MRQPILLDFAGRRRGVTVVGAGLVALGALAAAAVLVEYRELGAHRAGLEVRLAALHRAEAAASAPQEPVDPRLEVGAQQAALDLSTPWTLLLSELEAAGKESSGQVALLGVEPDHAKHTVRVTAEARTLSLALAYVERLQASRSLEYPMLDRHEVRADDAQHPVRFELTGEWRDLP